MAAILCRVCFVEPCKAVGRCCEQCCQCLGSCCDCFGQCISSCCKSFENCCDSISYSCDKPFSGCLFTSIIMNCVALVYGIISIVSGGNQCDEPLFILTILLLICAVINTLFSGYMYHTVNHDDNNPLFSQQGAVSNMSPSAKLYEFFKYDKWMALYIIFILILIALLSVSMAKAEGCSSDIGHGVFWICIILFAYLALSTLILFSYVAFDAFKEWAAKCLCWLIPFCWPCLIIGCCLNAAEDIGKSLDSRHNRNDASGAYVAPTQPNQPAAVVVPVVVQQPMIYAQPPVQNQVIYTQQQQPPAFNPAAPNQPGIVYVG